MKLLPLALLTSALLLATRVPLAAHPAPPPFLDVPPWNFAAHAVRFDQREGLLIGYPASAQELAENSVRQVYAGFAHARANGALWWVERFTYNRPDDWPAALQRASVASYAVSDLRTSVSGKTGTATFIARVKARRGPAVAQRMRVRLAFKGGNWRLDYADLASQSALFR